MVNQRTGTVTFLFTDIESSTDRWEADSAAMAASLAAHDAVLDAAIEGCGGRRFNLDPPIRFRVGDLAAVS